MPKNTGRGATRLIIPPNLPTFDCDEIVHIERMGGNLKFYFSGHAPVQTSGHVQIGQHIKVAVIWPIEKVGKAIRQTKAAVAAAALLKPDDDMGEPEGHG